MITVNNKTNVGETLMEPKANEPKHDGALAPKRAEAAGWGGGFGH